MSKHSSDKSSNSQSTNFSEGGRNPGGCCVRVRSPSGGCEWAVKMRLLRLPRTATADAMPTRNLGKTGYKVGIFSLGGQAALEKPSNEGIAVPIIERSLDLGVNYIDTSSIYGGRIAGRRAIRRVK